jgi:hypothetical protein
MRKFPSIFLVARDLPDSTELFAGMRPPKYEYTWATPTNGYTPVVMDARETADEVAGNSPGAYVVEFTHKP